MPDDDAAKHITITCPAKLNLTLAIGAPRDDGLHPIASVMVPISFGDELSIKRGDVNESRFERTWHPNAPRTSPIDWPIESDLVFRAHALLQQVTGQTLPIDLTLRKRVPVGAGLGGGSSNAAGVLVALRDLFRLSVDDEQLYELAGQLGSDVAFAVHALLGRGAAVVTGTGEAIEPLDKLPPFHAVLAFPEGACPTGTVYTAFDKLNANPRDTRELAQLAEAWQQSSSLPDPLNDLSAAASQVCPAIERAITTLGVLGHTAHLTGSGSTLFVIADDASTAMQITTQAGESSLAVVTTAYPPPA